ncbi:hypothetical protein Pint_33582 [Pistacia integerrima]|uniref:Uncharacterized protein n=1 Tax=Pistacia integerrima TaxID=434235 RepID=A0ACC0X2L6_9ROSI|nr:hypothetical protein Pint_33582 [Pistacia integerrima]
MISRDQVLREVHICITRAQAQMKKVYDSKHREREFQVGDQVYLKLQPYRQLTVAARKNLKLSARFYSPYEVLERIVNGDKLVSCPQAVLDRRFRKGKTEFLIHWQGLSPADATWEAGDILQERFPKFILEGEDRFQGKGNVTTI